VLMPKRVKYRKAHRGRLKGKAKSATTVDFGQYGLQRSSRAGSPAARSRRPRGPDALVKKGGKLWVRIFPDKPVSKKPAETRMGKGKGAPEFWVAVVKPGRIMFELEGLAPAEAQEAMRLASHKLPIKTKFVIREENYGEEG